jgi:hypothetical protein
MNDFKHLIISRVACKWYNEKGQLRCESELNKSWKDWSKESIELYDKFCRKSLKNQTNKNFTILSIFDQNITDYGNILPNEVILKLNNIDDIKNVVREYIVNSKINNKYILISRIDRDDCYKNNFVDILHKKINENEIKDECYFDISKINNYNLITKSKLIKDYINKTSPFVSTLEYNKKNINLYSLIGHNSVIKIIKGIDVNELNVLQIIHGNNLLNKSIGKETDFNLSDFGLE